MRWALVLASALPACYRPATEPACTVTCDFASDGADAPCPGDLQCFADPVLGGVCKTGGGSCDHDDAGPASDASDGGAFCYGHAGGWLRPCFPAAPTDVRQISGMIDTDLCNVAGSSVVAAGQDARDAVCMIVGDALMIGDLRAHGARPLALVAATSLTVTGPLDVSSSHFLVAQVGAGGNSHHCVAGTPPQTDTMGGFGGGAGGWFQGSGGAGGNNDTAENGGKPPMSLPDPTLLRGGCGGQSGIGSGMNGGPGGGAVYLISGGILKLEGVIDASGGGGAGVQGMSGGGGGSGGMIVIDAVELAAGIDGFLLANGGGGSSGGGLRGEDPSRSRPSTPAQGGLAPGAGGPGSAGATRDGGGGSDVALGENAGGGGGGAGYVYVHPSSEITAVVTRSSPPPSELP